MGLIFRECGIIRVLWARSRIIMYRLEIGHGLEHFFNSCIDWRLDMFWNTSLIHVSIGDWTWFGTLLQGLFLITFHLFFKRCPTNVLTEWVSPANLKQN